MEVSKGSRSCNFRGSYHMCYCDSPHSVSIAAGDTKSQPPGLGDMPPSSF